MKIITMKVKFDGLYFWGSGWKDNATKQSWDYFWDNEVDGIFWNQFSKKELGQFTRYLVQTNGSAYLHPMGFDVLLKKIGRSYTIDKDGNEVETYGDIEELKEICKNCASFCGGSVSFSGFKVSEIST